MLPVSANRIQGVRPATEKSRPLMQVAVNGAKLEDWFPGVDLEAAFQRPEGGYLLFSTNDVPYEETLNLILVDEGGRLIDSRSIFAPYATGYLHDVIVSGSHAISFSFSKGDRWVVEVASGMLKPQPQWLPRFLRRGLRVKRLD